MKISISSIKKHILLSYKCILLPLKYECDSLMWSCITVNPTIFFVGRSSSYTGATNTPIILNTEEVDRLNDWINDDEFLVPTTGFYFINLNAGFMTGEPANFVLEGIHYLNFCSKVV